MGAEATVSLVIVTHNSAAWLPAFGTSWRQTVQAAPLLRARTCTVVVADSGSTDATRTTAQELWPEARIIECGDVGFGTAANRGIAAVATDWVLLCNPDLVFPENFAQVMIARAWAAAENVQPPGGNKNDLSPVCIAPRLINPDGSTQASVGAFPTIASMIADQFRPREMRKYVHPQPRQPGPVDWATGACLLLNRAAFDAVGGFDELYFLYVEEVDLQRRLSAHGTRTWFAHDATVVHHAPNAARTPRENVQRWSALGLLRYFARHGSALNFLGYKALALASRRLKPRALFRSRKAILARSTRN